MSLDRDFGKILVIVKRLEDGLKLEAAAFLDTNDFEDSGLGSIKVEE